MPVVKTPAPTSKLLEAVLSHNDNIPLCDRLLRLREVVKMTSLGSSTIYRKLRVGGFPQPYALSPSCVRWRESEVIDWMDALPRLA